MNIIKLIFGTEILSFPWENLHKTSEFYAVKTVEVDDCYKVNSS